MQYFFELGNWAGLSQAELSRVLEIFGVSKDSVRSFSEKILILDNKNLNDEIVIRIFNRLGGFIRVGRVIEDLDNFLKIEHEGKLVFGISYLGDKRFETSKLDKLANDIKTFYKELGISSRFILPKKNELNAAQVIKNKVLSKGFELCILENSSTQIYGSTLSIQDIDSFSYRDYNKPSFDTDMGMLPPKLARIMCNLTGLKQGVIWDPFCGSGTIPMEASILGYNILASDMDSEALKSTEENIVWLSEQGLIGDILYETFRLDINKPDGKTISKLKHTDIDALVFEPYMGPPQTKVLSEVRANELLDGVKKLFLSLVELLEESGKRQIKMVAVIPSYKTINGWKTFGIREVFNKHWSVLNKEYSPQDLKWSRNNSIITRNIFILERK